MITEHIGEIKKAEENGISEVKTSEQKSRDRINEATQRYIEYEKKNQQEITQEYEKKIKEEKKKINDDLQRKKQNAQEEKIKFSHTVDLNIEKAVSLVENKIRGLYGNS